VRPRYVGLLVGLILGFVLMTIGFWKLLVVVAIGAVGYAVGAALSGDFDLQRIIDAFRRS
jgi:uncharacterized membrane protein